MTDSWNAKTYSQFLDLRTRPARDLLSAIPTTFQPKTVVDLGCGPGNSTILLKERWREAQVIGLDSSTSMLEQAKADYPSLSFIKGDIADFSPPEKVDCLFANASLQWLNAHDILIPKLLHCLHPGGVLGIQMPNNFHSPSHQVSLQLLQQHPAWHGLQQHLRYGVLTQPLYHLAWYYDLFSTCGAYDIQLWETTYIQIMSTYQECFDWVKGTALRAVLSAMDTRNQADFAKAYVQTIAKIYPLQADNHILLPFNRIFMTVKT